jgi:hypothetical protein
MTMLNQLEDGCSSIKKLMHAFNLFLVWIFGFFVLLSFDLFAEAFIFEWVEWNGTNKNDWFFALWWGLIVIWTLYGLFRIYLKWKELT